MKKVFAQTQQVAAVWAAQEQHEARTGSNTSFRGPRLFSYGTCVACIVKMPNGQPAALISNRQWSSGTSKVQGEAWGAANSRGLPVFRVWQPDVTATSDHIENLKDFEARIDAALEGVERAIKPQGWRDTAARLIAEAGHYAGTFAVRWKWNGRAPASVLSKKERAENG